MNRIRSVVRKSLNYHRNKVRKLFFAFEIPVIKSESLKNFFASVINFKVALPLNRHLKLKSKNVCQVHKMAFFDMYVTWNIHN